MTGRPKVFDGRGYTGLRYALAVGVLCAWGSVAGTGNRLSKMQQIQVRNQLQIFNSMMDGKLTLDQEYDLVHGPLRVAAEHDMAKNRAIAEKLMQKAMAMREKNQTKARDLMRMARAYKDYADQDARLAAACKSRKSQNVKLAIDGFKAAEKRVAQIIGKPVRRDWFLPAEAQKVAGQIFAKQQGKKGAGGNAAQ